MKFSHRGRIDVSFQMNRYDNVDDILKAIELLDIRGGNTNIALALRVARNHMFPPRNSPRSGTIPRLLILVTDGRATEEAYWTIPEANTTKADGIQIFTVGIGKEIDREQLKAIATAPWETHFFFV